METVNELKSQLHAIELSANKLRQQLADSQYEAKSVGGTVSYEIITPDDWNFTHSGKKFSNNSIIVMNALKQLSVGDMTRIGPFASNKEAQTVRSRVSWIANKNLGWGETGAVETHIKGNYVYVKRLK